ncbi:MAG: hypothetical protein WDM89_13700 [Rhizomicrobium sp.]
MTIDRPYRRTVRQLVDGNYARNGQGRYVSHPKFAQDAAMYVRAFLLLQKDVQEIFDYIEPADKNLNTYSFRTHALLLRSFIEVEANFKAILQEKRIFKKARFEYGWLQETRSVASPLKLQSQDSVLARRGVDPAAFCRIRSIEPP